MDSQNQASADRQLSNKKFDYPDRDINEIIEHYALTEEHIADQLVNKNIEKARKNECRKISI
jgi:hypothetical protein